MTNIPIYDERFPHLKVLSEAEVQQRAERQHRRFAPVLLAEACQRWRHLEPLSLIDKHRAPGYPMAVQVHPTFVASRKAKAAHNCPAVAA